MRFRLNSKGFSMIELAIVVAIVGAMVSLAVPSYNGYVAKAKQGEAKASLTRIYVSEQSFFSEWGWYTLCLWQTGYYPTGSDFYYLTGFMNASAPFPKAAFYSTDPDPLNSACQFDNRVAWNGTFRNDATFENNHITNIGAVSTLTSQRYDVWDATSPGHTTAGFKAVAWGSISNSPTLDVWTIGEDRALKNLSGGL